MSTMVAQGRLNQRYRLVRRLGGGAEAEVFLALDGQRDDTPRALKVLRVPGGAERGAAWHRLAAEFRRLSALAHPRLVRVYDLEVAGAGGFEAGTESGVGGGAGSGIDDAGAKPSARTSLRER